VKKEISNILGSIYEADYWTVPAVAEEKVAYSDDKELQKLEEEMKSSAEKLEFERAAKIRDRIKAIKEKRLEIGVRT
jgi:excinuclease ABC subunit B